MSRQRDFPEGGRISSVEGEDGFDAFPPSGLRHRFALGPPSYIGPTTVSEGGDVSRHLRWHQRDRFRDEEAAEAFAR